MTPTNAVENASGGGSSESAFIVVGFICAAILLWAAWSLLSVYVGWARTRVRESTLQFAIYSGPQKSDHQ